MNVHCYECGTKVRLANRQEFEERYLLCGACDLARLRFNRTMVTYRDLDEPLFDPALPSEFPEVAERMRVRADDCRLS